MVEKIREFHSGDFLRDHLRDGMVEKIFAFLELEQK